MKRILAIIMALIILASMAACGAKETPAATPAPATPAPTAEPTPEPTPTPTPEPEWEPGLARAKYGEATYTTLEHGTEVTVYATFGDYYVIKGEEVDLLIEQWFLRLSDEEPFEAWPGYARSGARVFADGYMDGEVLAELKQNTEVQVLDGKGHWLFIEWEGGSGYVHKDEISDSYIRSYQGGGGGGGGGPQDGTDVSMGGLAAYSGEKPGVSFVAEYFGPKLEKRDEISAITLCQETRAYLFLTYRDDTVQVTELGEDVCQVYIEGFFATMPRWLLSMEGDEPYESWTGYACGNALAYEEYQLRNVEQELKLNEQVLVIDELPTCYVVEINGEVLYMSLDSISVSVIPVYSGGGGGGAGGGGGGGAAEWTPPEL